MRVLCVLLLCAMASCCDRPHKPRLVIPPEKQDAAAKLVAEIMSNRSAWANESIAMHDAMEVAERIYGVPVPVEDAK